MKQQGLLMKYFVLKPSGNNIYASASRTAMRAYAHSIENQNLTLSRELREWADSETDKAINEKKETH